MYFNTFGGNPVSAAAANAMMRVMQDEKLVENCRKVGDYFRMRLEELKLKHPVIGNVRGRGLFLGVELVKDRESREPASELAALMPDRFKDEGVLIGMTGRLGNVLKFRLPLVTSRSHIDIVIRTMDKVLATTPSTSASDVQCINSGIVTEAAIARWAASGSRRLSLGRAARLTPLALDKAHELGVEIIRGAG